jgi:hypothetical protein
MPEGEEQHVTVRRLPDGGSHPALFDSLNGQILRILEVPVGVDVNAGDLVEVNSAKTMYLGEVRRLQGETMIVGVEHALDRETLALIQQVWHGPAGQ